jgi:hypothetical protein
MKNIQNPGAFMIIEKFIDKTILDKTIDELSNYNWAPVWADKRYAGDHWMTCPLIDGYDKTLNFQAFVLGAIIEKKMKCQIKNLMFYAMLPGGDIPPHRDMVGNVGMGGLRLHIPIVTNDKVNFVVDRKKVVMGVGELWALDTSYTHSVSNHGSENRVHLVMDIIVNEWVLSLLPPKNLRFYIHQYHLLFLGLLKFLKYLYSKDMKLKDFLSVVYNAIKLKFLKK